MIWCTAVQKTETLEILKFSDIPLCGAAVVFFAWWSYKPEVEDGNYKLPRALAVAQEFKLKRRGQEQALHMGACYKEN